MTSINIYGLWNLKEKGRIIHEFVHCSFLLKTINHFFVTETQPVLTFEIFHLMIKVI